jgi:hypothetical protein
MTQETKDGNSPPQQIVSDHEWSVWINNSKITGDTLNRVQKHIQETEMSKWLAANRKHGREPCQHNGHCRRLEEHHAWATEMAYKNESEICASWEEYAQMGGSGRTVDAHAVIGTMKMKSTCLNVHIKNARTVEWKLQECCGNDYRDAKLSTYYSPQSSKKYNNMQD